MQWIIEGRLAVKTGDITREIQSIVHAPGRLRLEKQGDYISMSVAAAGQPFEYAGGTFRLSLKEPYYIGLGVCAHNNDVLETAIFSNVMIEKPEPKARWKPFPLSPSTGRSFT